MAAVESGYQAHNNFSLPRRPIPQNSQLQKAAQPQPSQAQPYAPDQYRSASHGHSRSASSGTFPTLPPQSSQQHASQPYMSQQHQPPQSQSQTQTQFPPPRRTYSNATTSTTSTGGAPQRRNSNTSSLQRSISSRSGSSPSSYVALMRKQKATVWSDRTQHEDPRMAAQQRAAKMRAAMEVSGAGSVRASTSGSSITGGVRSKIRHHGAPKAREYTPLSHPSTGVPLRLSAREVDEEGGDDDYLAGRSAHHHRTGSGRSSLGSGGRRSSGYGAQQPNFGMTSSAGQSSEGSTPPLTRDDTDSPGASRARAETQSTVNSKNGPTPVPQHYSGNDYFSQKYVGPSGPPISGNSEDSEENSFGDVGKLPQRNPSAAQHNETDLARRGSVDDRTATMSGYKRLYIANPDVDSD